MVKFEELERKIFQQSREKYSFTDDGEGKKTYIVFSEELKQKMRDVVYSAAQEGEWQISHSLGENFVEYKKEQDEKFGSYRKSLVETSPDEFRILSGKKSLIEKSKFNESKNRIEETRQRIEESKARIEETRRRIERHKNRTEEVGGNIGECMQDVSQKDFPQDDKSYISFITE